MALITCTDLGTTPRKALTDTQRLKLFEAHRGICALCGNKIQAGERWIVERLRPLSLGGGNEAANLAPAHEACADGKTYGPAATSLKPRRPSASSVVTSASQPRSGRSSRRALRPPHHSAGQAASSKSNPHPATEASTCRRTARMSANAQIILILTVGFPMAVFVGWWLGNAVGGVARDIADLSVGYAEQTVDEWLANGGVVA